MKKTITNIIKRLGFLMIVLFLASGWSSTKAQTQLTQAYSFLNDTLKPYSLIPGDFDNDGTNDILGFYQNIKDGKKMLYFMKAKSTTTIEFSYVQQDYATLNFTPIDGKVADYDNDGDLDIFVNYNSYNDSISSRLLINNGNGVFDTTALSFTFPKVNYEDLLYDTIDYNKDGKTDLIGFLTKSQTFHLLENKGSNEFEQKTVPGFDNIVLGSSSVNFNVADYNNDGYSDIAVVDPYEYLQIFTNDKNNSFTKEASFTYIAKIVSGDFNNDGVTEILGSRNQDYKYVTFENNSFNVTESNDTLYQSSGASPFVSIFTGNFNDDAIPDLALSIYRHNVSNTAKILNKKTTGLKFEENCQMPISTSYNSIGLVCDFNNDGIDEIKISSELFKLEKSYITTIKTIDEDSLPISGASITINEINKTTDYNGKALFNLLNGDYGYSIKANGYAPIVVNADDNDKLVVNGEEKTVSYTMKKLCNITVNITNTDSTAIEYANLYFGDSSFYVQNGKEEFSILPGTYGYIVSSVNYQDIHAAADSSAAITISADTTLNFSLLKTAQATLIIADAINNKGIEGASLSINNETYTSDGSGQITIPNLVEGSYGYTLTKENYFELNVADNDKNALVINDFTYSDSIKMGIICKLTFKVIDNNDAPISGANVELYGRTEITNADGEATFAQLPSMLNAPYTLSKQGYYPYSDKCSIKYSESSFKAKWYVVETPEKAYISTYVNIFTDGYWSYECGDFDNDNDIDIIARRGIVGQANDQLSLFKNNGSGIFEEINLNWNKEQITKLKVGDFNNDGNLDFSGYMIDGGSINIVVCLNQGNAQFATDSLIMVTSMNDDIHGSGGYYVGEFNGDDYLDMILYNIDANVKKAYYYGTGTSFTKQDKAINFDIITAVYNIDNDSIDDILTDKSIVFGNGTTQALDTVVAGSNAYFVDMDNDGDVDLFTSGFALEWSGSGFSMDNFPFMVYFENNNNEFTLVEQADFTIENRVPQNSVVADFDNDGDIDIIQINGFGGGYNADYYLNDGKGKFSRDTINTTYLLGVPSTYVHAYDFTGDTKSDVLIDGQLFELKSFSYKVTFTITDGINNLEGVSLTFNNQTLSSDANGQITFTDINNGTYGYSATKDGYQSIELSETDNGAIVINGADKQIEISMQIIDGITEEKKSVNVYPTYSTGNVNVIINNNLPANIAVYSLQGRCISSIKTNDTHQLININSQNGMYFIQIVDSENNKSTHKVIIKE